MGKTRRIRKQKATKSNPLRAALAIEDEYSLGYASETDTNGPVEAVRQQLQSANIEEKLNGLHTLAVLTASMEKVASVCKSDVVRIASPLLCEKEITVRSAAAGALRNLSTCGVNVCEFLVEKDVLTPLLVLLKEYAQNSEWTPSFDASMRGQIDLRSDVFLHAINLMWNLCESSSLAVDALNQSQLLESLMRCLDYKLFGLDIAISFAQCLLVVSENNPKAWSILNERVTELLKLLSISGEHGHSYLRTLAAGILVNVPALAAAHTTEILSALSYTLTENHIEALNRVPLQQSDEHKPELEIKMDIVDEETEEEATYRRRCQELPTSADIVVRDLGYLLDSQRVAAEVMTNIFCTDEEEWEDAENEDETSDNEVVIEYGLNNSNTQSNTHLYDADRLPIEMLETIKSMNFVDKLWQKTQPIQVPLIQMLRQTDNNLVLKTKNLRISSLICLQNLCNILSAEDLGGSEAIYNVWVDLCQQIFKEQHDATILEPLTSLMRSALERVKSSKNLFTKMTKEDLEMILGGIKSTGVSNVAELRANWLRMLGTLGCLLSEEFVRIILPNIVSSCAQEEDVWTISEGLDALMDIFADNDWHNVIVDLNLAESVKELEKILKTKLRQQKRELKDRYPAVKTVQENFSRFVKYIESESIHGTHNL